MSSAMPLVKGLSAACSMKATVRGLLHSTAWMQMCSGRCRNSFAADSGDPSTSTCPHTTGAEGEAGRRVETGVCHTSNEGSCICMSVSFVVRAS